MSFPTSLSTSDCEKDSSGNLVCVSNPSDLFGQYSFLRLLAFQSLILTLESAQNGVKDSLGKPDLKFRGHLV
jgi:hypothetical protein